MKVKVYEGCDDTRSVILIGHEFGPCLLCTNADMDDAIDEWDEQFGDRVNPADPALDDYPGDTPEERLNSAIDSGEIRVNSGGTMVWVSPYEWAHEYPNRAEAEAFCAKSTRGAVEYVGG